MNTLRVPRFFLVPRCTSFPRGYARFQCPGWAERTDATQKFADLIHLLATVDGGRSNPPEEQVRHCIASELLGLSIQFRPPTRCRIETSSFHTTKRFWSGFGQGCQGIEPLDDVSSMHDVEYAGGSNILMGSSDDGGRVYRTPHALYLGPLEPYWGNSSSRCGPTVCFFSGGGT